MLKKQTAEPLTVARFAFTIIDPPYRAAVDYFPQLIKVIQINESISYVCLTCYSFYKRAP